MLHLFQELVAMEFIWEFCCLWRTLGKLPSFVLSAEGIPWCSYVCLYWYLAAHVKAGGEQPVLTRVALCPQLFSAEHAAHGAHHRLPALHHQKRACWHRPDRPRDGRTLQCRRNHCQGLKGRNWCEVQRCGWLWGGQARDHGICEFLEKPKAVSRLRSKNPKGKMNF